MGLLLDSGLPEGGGLRIPGTSNITMLFMRFGIDALFLDRSGTVVRAAAGLRPWRISIAARGAAEVVELPIGTIARSGTQAGDVVVFE
jgi:uncharacterized protein